MDLAMLPMQVRITTIKMRNPLKQRTKRSLVDKAPKGKVTNNDHAGLDNPHYALFTDYYGDVYARYVGPYDGYIAWSIWVPKTLVTNMRGPIEKWVPKTKH